MLAHKLGKTHKVMLIAKQSLLETNSRYAQGGIASVLSPEDSFDKHVEDTLEAGLYPFVVGDLIKLYLAGALLPAAWALVKRFKG